MKNDAIKKVYGRAAGFYDLIFGPIADFGRKRVVQTINDLPSGRILEVGVGTGISLSHYKPEHRISGIDLSPEMLQRAERRVSDGNLENVDSLEVMDAQEMTFADSSFDAVVAMYVMSVVPSPETVIAEMQRVCKPGGKIFIVNHFSESKGFMSKLEKFLEPYSDSLGWSPHFPLDSCLQSDSLKLQEQKKVPPVGFFTMLVCDNETRANGQTAASMQRNGVAHTPQSISSGDDSVSN